MYGHLRPKDLLAQLAALAKVNNMNTLPDLTVIVERILCTFIIHNMYPQ